MVKLAAGLYKLYHVTYFLPSALPSMSGTTGVTDLGATIEIKKINKLEYYHSSS